MGNNAFDNSKMQHEAYNRIQTQINLPTVIVIKEPSRSATVYKNKIDITI